MNIIQKIYCRTFQFCFKMAIPILPYRNGELYDSVERIALVLREKEYEKVLIITGKIVRSLPVFKRMEAQLIKNNIRYTVFDKTVSNPTIENVEEARKIYLENECQALIGFGGGSAIDCAKAVGARIVKKNQSIQKMAGILKIHKKTPFLIAVPTTAGTGSEITVTTVITDEKTKKKSPISDFCLIPDVAVLDNEATKTLPGNIISTTGMDALTHAVEAFIGNSTTKETRSDAVFALKLIFENLYTAYDNPEDDDARRNMLYASFLAGRAFSKSYVGYCHAVAHSLGGKYNLPHGLCNAVLLPYVLKEYGKSAQKKLCRLAIETNICQKGISEKEGAEAFVLKIEEMNRRMNIPDKLECINNSDIPFLAIEASREANPLYPVPRLMNARELEKLYYQVAEGEKSDKV